MLSKSFRPGDRVSYKPTGHQGTVMLAASSAHVLFDGFQSPVAVPMEKLRLIPAERTGVGHGDSRRPARHSTERPSAG